MKIMIAGATGFIGAALADRLRREGHELVLLSRRPPRRRGRARERWLAWDPAGAGEWQRIADGMDGIGAKRVAPAEPHRQHPRTSRCDCRREREAEILRERFGRGLLRLPRR
jgi:uncharacterized protein YbjT (DUF2867 family)